MSLNCKKHAFCNCPVNRDCSVEPLSGHIEGILDLNSVHQNKYERFPYNSIQKDPLLFNGAHATYIDLDRTLPNSIPLIKNIYSDPELRTYGKNYTSYKDINAGDITYYLDSDIRNVNGNSYYRKQYSDTKHIETSLFKSPMDTYSYQTKRIPEEKPEYSLSWMEDTQHFRNDLGFKQLSILSRNIR